MKLTFFKISVKSAFKKFFLLSIVYSSEKIDELF